MLSVLYLIVLALAQLACAQDQPVMLYVSPAATYVPTKGDLFAVSHIIYDSSAPCINESKTCNHNDSSSCADPVLGCNGVRRATLQHRVPSGRLLQHTRRFRRNAILQRVFEA